MKQGYKLVKPSSSAATGTKQHQHQNAKAFQTWPLLKRLCSERYSFSLHRLYWPGFNGSSIQQSFELQKSITTFYRVTSHVSSVFRLILSWKIISPLSPLSHFPIFLKEIISSFLYGYGQLKTNEIGWKLWVEGISIRCLGMNNNTEAGSLFLDSKCTHNLMRVMLHQSQHGLCILLQ